VSRPLSWIKGKDSRSREVTGRRPEGSRKKQKRETGELWEGARRKEKRKKKRS